MLYSSSEEAVADSYFAFANDIAGVFSISLSATALQFEHPQPFANFFLFITVIWVISKRTEYAKIVKRYGSVRFKGFIGILRLFWKIKIFLIGIACLAYIGAGLLTKDFIYKVTGF